MSAETQPGAPYVLSPRTVSVVICAYTMARWNALASAISSVDAQSTPFVELIIVIDHNDELFAAVQARWADIVCIENEGKPGISASRNAALKIAQGQIIAFLDDDAVADEDWLKQLVAAYDDPRVIGTGGYLEPIWVAGKPDWFPDEFGWVVGCSYAGQPTGRSRIRNAIGANMSVRADLAKDIGGFSAHYGKVGLRSEPEDTEFCIRCSQNWPDRYWIYEPTAVVRHRVTVLRSTFRYFLFRCFREGHGKATLSQLVGSEQGLKAERAYLGATLPLAVVRYLWQAISRLSLAPAERSIAILFGMAAAGLGFVWARVAAFGRLARPAYQSPTVVVE